MDAQVQYYEAKRDSAPQRAPEEHSGFRPIALHRAHGDAERRGNLLLGEPTEESAFDNAGETRGDFRELVERVVELQHDFGLVVDADDLLVEGDAPAIAIALEGSPRLSPVHEHVSHGDRRKRQKMGAVLNRRPRLVDNL